MRKISRVAEKLLALKKGLISIEFYLVAGQLLDLTSEMACRKTRSVVRNIEAVVAAAM
jgi:hypothetical protein